jgi:hypothetical protein
LAWRGHESGPADVLSEAEKEYLMQIKGLFLPFPAYSYEDERFINRFITDIQNPSYVFYLGHYGTKSKLRSYQKIFTPSFKNPFLQFSDLIQVEVDYAPNQSLFACVIRLNEQNRDYCLKEFTDYHCAYLISNNLSVFSEEFVRNTVKKAAKYYPKKDYWAINYPAFVLEYCQEGTFMFRSMAGNDQIFWNVFLHQNDLPRILPIVRKTVKEFSL